MGADELVSGLLGLVQVKKECESQIKALLQTFENDLQCKITGVEIFKAGQEIMEVKIKLDL